VNGKRKPTFFAEHRDTPRFAQYRQKLLHYEIPELAYTKDGRPVHQSEIDRLHRDEMRAALHLAGVQPGDVVVAGNANEIPSASTVGLFVACDGWPSNATTIGLLLEPFVFSFELGVHSEPVGGSFGELARVSTYTKALQSAAFSRKSIGRSESGGAGPVLIRDAGWKCTCCFPALADYIDHCQDLRTNFRFGSNANRRHAELVQRVLCGGKAEGAVSGSGSEQTHSSAQNLRAGGDMPGTDRWGRSVGVPAAIPLHRQHGTGGVPAWLGEQAAASRGESSDVPAALFLLPGHCERVIVNPTPAPAPAAPLPPTTTVPAVPAGAVAAAQAQATVAPKLPVGQKPQKEDGRDPGDQAKHDALPAVVGSATAGSGKGQAAKPSVASTTLSVPDKADVAPSMATKPTPSSSEESEEPPEEPPTGGIPVAAQDAIKQRVKKGHGRDR
jgi:hypothetical protein